MKKDTKVSKILEFSNLESKVFNILNFINIQTKEQFLMQEDASKIALQQF